MNKYLTLIGSLAMLLVFLATFPITFANPSGANWLISVTLFSFAAVGLTMYFKEEKKTKKEPKEEFMPLP